MRARVILQARLNLEAKARAAAVEAAKEIYGVLDGRFAAAMKSEVWQWANERGTVRRKGNRKGPPVVVFSPRNIIDSGDLANSKTQTISGLLCSWRWPLPYAAAIHEGAKLKNGGIIQPRPWTDAVLGRIPFASGVEPYDYRRAFRDAWLSAYRRGN